MFSVVAMVIGSFGEAALAAHTVAYQITFIVFQVGVGFSHGGSILVSRYHAVKRSDLCRSAALRAAAIMATIVALAGVAFLTAPTLLLRPFLPTADVSTISVFATLLAIGALTEFVDVGQNLGVGMLRGLGDTHTGLLASVIGYWAVGLPAALLFGYACGLGAAGIWWGLAVGLGTSCAILWGRFLLRTSGAR